MDKRTTRLAVPASIALAFTTIALSCSNGEAVDAPSISLDGVAEAFREAGYLAVATGPIRHPLWRATLVVVAGEAASGWSDEFWLFEYGSDFMADIGWLQAGAAVRQHSLPMERGREGRFVWYGTARAIALFERARESRIY